MRDRRLGAVTALVGALAIVAAAFGGCTSRAADASADGCRASRCIEVGAGAPIRLGALLWLGSADAETGRDSLRGVQLAVDYLDGEFDGIPGRLLGHRVVVASRDDGCDAVAGSVGAEKILASGEGVIGAVGTTCSSSALGAADGVFEGAGLPLISPSNTAPALTSAARHTRTYLRTAPNDRIQGRVDANFARLALRSERAATIATPTPYPSALARVFADSFRANGGTIATSAMFDAAGSPAAAVEQVAAAAPDVVFVPVQGVQTCNDTIGALRADPRLADTRIITADGCLTAGTLEAIRTRPVPPVFASGPDSSAVAANAFYTQQFLPAYTSLYGTAPTGVWHPNAFDAASMLFDAVRRSARLQPDGSVVILKRDLLRALYATHGYDGLSGILDCRRTGDCARSARISLYAAPAWPVAGGDATARAFFTQKVTLADALG